MTFIVTVVSEGPTRSVPERVGPFVLDPVIRDDGAADRAGFLPALRRYLGRPVHGNAVHVLLEGPHGYFSSNALFEYSEEDEPARLRVPAELRAALETVIDHCLVASAERRILVIAEDNGHVTDPDLSSDELETIDVVGPLQSSEFWRMVDLHQLHEDSLVIVEG